MSDDPQPAATQAPSAPQPPDVIRLPGWLNPGHPLLRYERTGWFGPQRTRHPRRTRRLFLLGLLAGAAFGLLVNFLMRHMYTPDLILLATSLFDLGLGAIVAMSAVPMLQRDVQAGRWHDLRVTPYSVGALVRAKAVALAYRLAPLIGFWLGKGLLLTLYLTSEVAAFMPFDSAENNLLNLGTGLTFAVMDVGLSIAVPAACGLLASALTTDRAQGNLAALALFAGWIILNAAPLSLNMSILDFFIRTVYTPYADRNAVIIEWAYLVLLAEGLLWRARRL